MTPFQKLREAIHKTEVIRSPKQLLATFGQTQIEYYLVSDIVTFPDRSRLRYGGLIAQRPQIITSESVQERFEGFGSEAKQFGDWLLSTYGRELRGLHYQFVNRLESNRLQHTNSQELVRRITENLDVGGPKRVTVLKGPDEAWQLSLLKFIIDISTNSFRGNVQELEERGFFDSETRTEYHCKAEIEDLFKKARQDRSIVSLLAQKLKEYRLLEQYQDRFFNLIKER